MFLLEVVESLRRFNVSYAVVGGYAVALHGAVRGTVDLDIVIALSEKSYVDTEKALLSIDLRPKLPLEAKELFHFRKEYVAKRNLRAWSFYDPKDPTRLVDVIVTYEKKRIPIKHVTYQGTKIAILTKSELIKMKMQSGRPQDLEDVKALRMLS
jgi:hypothetical protein